MITRKIIRIIQGRKKLFFFACDVFLIALAVVLAFEIRFEGAVPAHYFFNIIRLILVCEVFCLSLFVYERLYSFSWSYVSTQDLIALAKATGISFLLAVAFLFIFRDLAFFSGFPRSTIFITFFLIFIFCGGIRFAKRLYRQIIPVAPDPNRERTLIVGAGDTGEQIVRSIVNSRVSPYLPVAFVDDNRSRWGVLIHGVKVAGPISDIPDLVSKLAVSEMIIALPSAGTETIKRAVELGRSAGLKKIKTVPPISEVIDGKISFANVREVELEDLMEREPISLDTRLIGDFLRQKTILVTGAAGSIGSELCRQIAKFAPKTLLVLDQDETGIFNILRELKENHPRQAAVPLVADICDREKIGYVMEQHRPAVVFHAAAYKHVPLMEEAVDEAVKNNIFGTKTVAEAALVYRAEKFIMISTDKAVNPTSVMGATKRACEMICRELNGKNSTKFISVRFGNVLNSRGSVIPIFREQIKRGGPVEVTHPEMKRYFMLTSEACLLVMQAAAMGKGGEVFVLNMGKPLKIIDLAREMIKLSGFDPDKDIPIVFVGPRPGEKLFEEILTAEEGVVATQNQQIFIANLSEVVGPKIGSALEILESAAKENNRQKMIDAIRNLIPSYGGRG